MDPIDLMRVFSRVTSLNFQDIMPTLLAMKPDFLFSDIVESKTIAPGVEKWRAWGSGFDSDE